MPKRATSHITEDQSRRLFATRIPPEWVIRSVVRDYGIDEEVEVFDKNGIATGLSFFAQLKGTDGPRVDAALKFSLKTHTIQYYRSLQLPVMVVRFHRPTGSFFWKWFHEFRLPSAIGTKSVSLKMPPSAEWGEQTAGEVVASLRMFRQLKGLSPPHPIVFMLGIQGAEIHGVASSVIRSALFDAVSGLGHFVEFTDKTSIGAKPEVTISNDSIMVSLAGLGGITLRIGKGYPEPFARSFLAHDVLCAIAYVFARAGYSAEAAEIAATHLPLSTLFNVSEICAWVLRAMSRAQKVPEALHLAKTLINANKGQMLVQGLFSVARQNSGSLVSQELEYLREVMQLFVDKAAELGDAGTEAVAHYNLGNQLRSQGQKYRKAAVREYRLASKCDPKYRERPYFWMELAGLLFLSSHYRCSTNAYRRAFQLGSDVKTEVLLADALMFSGEYREAFNLFRDYIQRDPNAVAEWRLKKLMLSTVIDALGIVHQKRQPKLANELADISALSEGEIRDRLEAAIQADALCSYAWYNRGAYFSQSGQRQEAFLSYLFSAICRPGDIEAWCLALLNGLLLPQHKILSIRIAQMAYSCNGHAFLQSLEEFAKTKLPEVPHTQLMNLVGEAVKHVDRVGRRAVFRLLGAGSTYEEWSLSDGSA